MIVVNKALCLFLGRKAVLIDKEHVTLIGEKAALPIVEVAAHQLTVIDIKTVVRAAAVVKVAAACDNRVGLGRKFAGAKYLLLSGRNHSRPGLAG